MLLVAPAPAAAIEVAIPEPEYAKPTATDATVASMRSALIEASSSPPEIAVEATSSLAVTPFPEELLLVLFQLILLSAVLTPMAAPLAAPAPAPAPAPIEALIWRLSPLLVVLPLVVVARMR